MGSVFISHAEEDQGLAIEIATGLEACGFETWYFERDSEPGLSYLIQVHHAIEKCVAVVLLISPSSIRSHQMTKEVVRANDLGKPFIPVRSNISHTDFQARQPEWSIAIGASASIPVPIHGVSGILPRIVRGLEALRSDEAARNEHREDVQTGRVPSTTPAGVMPIETHATREPVAPPIENGIGVQIAPLVSPGRTIASGIIHGSGTIVQTTVLRDSAPSKRSRQAAAAIAAVVVLSVGTYWLTRQTSPASALASVVSSSAASSNVAEQPGRQNPSQPVANSGITGASRAALVSPAPSKTPEAPSSSISLPTDPSKDASKNLPASAIGYDNECRELLRVVRDAEKKQNLSNELRSELGRTGRRLVQIQQDLEQFERDRLTLSKLEAQTERRNVEQEIARNELSKRIQLKQAELNTELNTISLRLSELGVQQVRHIKA